MRKIIIILLLLFAYNTAISQITKNEAYNIVKNQLENEGINMEIYSFPTLVPPQELITVQDSFIMSPNYYSWFFFVNPYPYANWGHECWYIFVNSTNAEYTTIIGYFSPDELYNYDVHNSVLTPFVYNADSIFNIPSVDNNGGHLNTDYAIIISGGDKITKNWPRYWFDCSAVYKTLVNKYHYDKNHIIVLMANGLNSNNCYNFGTENNPNFGSMSYDLDQDGVNDIQYAANSRNLVQVFNDLKQQVTNKDNVFIFVTDHGGPGSTISLWYQTISSNWFSEQVNKLSNA